MLTLCAFSVSLVPGTRGRGGAGGWQRRRYGISRACARNDVADGLGCWLGELVVWGALHGSS